MNSNPSFHSATLHSLAPSTLQRVNDYRLPSLDALLAFATAAQTMNIEGAAKCLALTTSALRKRLFTIEQLLGLQLIDRQGGPLALTAQGQLYLDQIAPILAQLLAVPLHSRQVQRRQRLLLSCPPTFAWQILVPRLAEHSLAYPEVDLQVQLCAPLTRRNQQDISICGDSSEVAPRQRLLEERLQPMVAPALLQRFGSLQLPEDFVHLPLLRSPLEPWRPWLALDEPAQGVVLARPSLARPWLEQGRLLPLGEVRSLPSYHYALHQQSSSPEAGAFCAWLRRICLEAVHQGEQQLGKSL